MIIEKTYMTMRMPTHPTRAIPLFFFSCYCDHRDLHSFPTRRSSDLRPLHLALLVLDGLGRRDRGLPRSRPGGAGAGQLGHLPVERALDRRPGCHDDTRRDAGGRLLRRQQQDDDRAPERHDRGVRPDERERRQVLGELGELLVPPEHAGPNRLQGRYGKRGREQLDRPACRARARRHPSATAATSASATASATAATSASASASTPASPSAPASTPPPAPAPTTPSATAAASASATAATATASSASASASAPGLRNRLAAAATR